jgi:plastocyanin
MRVRMLLVASVAGMSSSAVALAGSTTTGPGQHATFFVQITDTGIVVDNQAREARGTIVTFAAINEGKKPHNFTMLGKKTPILKAGGRAHFTVTLLTRGNFPYRSTVDKGRFFHGLFTVY